VKTHTAIKNLDTENQIVFECIDGYKPMMPLQKFFSVKSFLAVTDAPKVNYGQKIIKDGNEMKRLLVYQAFLQKKLILNVHPIKIHLVPFNDENIAFLF
jgi:hypothetical protein